MLLSVVFTDRPSKCSQSKGAGLLGLNKIGVIGGRGPDCEVRGVEVGGANVDDDPWLGIVGLSVGVPAGG